jgi:hypothetical protein
LRKPFGDRLDCCGKIAGFSDAEEKACEPKLKGSVGQRVPHCGKAPDTHDEDIADARANLVHQSAGNKQTNRVCSLEGIDDIAVVEFRQANGVLERGLEQRDDLTVHVVNGGREEEHGADGPAYASKRRVLAFQLLGFGRERLRACPA